MCRAAHEPGGPRRCAAALRRQRERRRKVSAEARALDAAMEASIAEAQSAEDEVEAWISRLPPEVQWLARVGGLVGASEKWGFDHRLVRDVLMGDLDALSAPLDLPPAPRPLPEAGALAAIRLRPVRRPGGLPDAVVTALPERERRAYLDADPRRTPLWNAAQGLALRWVSGGTDTAPRRAFLDALSAWFVGLTNALADRIDEIRVARAHRSTSTPYTSRA